VTLPAAVRNSGGFRFPRADRLKKRSDIRTVFKRGKVVACPGMKLFYRAGALENNQIAITFARKFGNAVQRNRARRLCREAYRHLRYGLMPPRDLVLLIYPGYDSFNARLEQLMFLLKRAGLLEQL
jgi:ribonuclease P protein component